MTARALQKVFRSTTYHLAPKLMLAKASCHARLFYASGTWHRPARGQLVRLAKAHYKPYRNAIRHTWNPTVDAPLTTGLVAAQLKIPILEYVLAASRLCFASRVNSGPVFRTTFFRTATGLPLARSVVARPLLLKSYMTISVPRASGSSCVASAMGSTMDGVPRPMVIAGYYIC